MVERSEADPDLALAGIDCFVASLLAMTRQQRAHCSAMPEVAITFVSFS